MGLLSGLLNRAAGTSRRGTRGAGPVGTGTGTGTGRPVGRSGVGGLLGRFTRGRRSL